MCFGPFSLFYHIFEVILFWKNQSQLNQLETANAELETVQQLVRNTLKNHQTKRLSRQVFDIIFKLPKT